MRFICVWRIAWQRFVHKMEVPLSLSNLRSFTLSLNFLTIYNPLLSYSHAHTLCYTHIFSLPPSFSHSQLSHPPSSGLYIKLGQGVASLNHILPSQFRAAFTCLQDQAPASPYPGAATHSHTYSRTHIRTRTRSHFTHMHARILTHTQIYRNSFVRNLTAKARVRSSQSLTTAPSLAPLSPKCTRSLSLFVSLCVRV